MQIFFPALLIYPSGSVKEISSLRHIARTMRALSIPRFCTTQLARPVERQERVVVVYEFRVLPLS
jgi:hypothetical protein